MGEVVEIQVSKGLTKQTGEKEWLKLEYTVKAKLDAPEELQIAKAQLESIVDTWLQQSFQLQPVKRQPVSKPDLEHGEVYEKLNWENGSGSRGAYQMVRRDNVNDLQLYNHLENMLKQNKGNLGIGNWHYWLGQEGFIFRRAKKPKAT
ncbi:MAG: hypothetical protein QXZ02_03840 [Candidatus Bathyarchaeia archaeon]